MMTLDQKGHGVDLPTSLPQVFTDRVLPPGDYSVTFAELEQSLLVVGPHPKSPNWDTAWRRSLVTRAAPLVAQLWAEGVGDVYLDGSFTEEVDHPGDIDGYYVSTQQDIASGLLRRLNARNPQPIWHMSNLLPDPDSRKPKPIMWHIHKVELYADYGHFSGIRDEFGQRQTFPAAFRKARRERGWKPKGIIHLLKSLSQNWHTVCSSPRTKEDKG